jgi:hypothetical protein
MAEIHLSAMNNSFGPAMPQQHGAWLRDAPWPGGGTVKHLMLSIGDSTIDIWPADAERIRELADKLAKIAKSLENGVNQ